jgi:hypothetical protein
VQHHDKAGRWLQVMGCKREHPEIARIRPEACGLNQRATVTGPQVSFKIPKTIDTVQLWQTSQEFDIVGERHRQLLIESSSNAHRQQIVAALQNKKTACCQSPELCSILIDSRGCLIDWHGHARAASMSETRRWFDTTNSQDTAQIAFNLR